jgi:hypothetical protein
MGSQRIDEFVEFFLKLEPKFETAMTGASPQDITILQEVAGVDFCASYRRFLHYFGRTNTGVLNPFLWDYSFSIDDATEFYRELREENMTSPDSVVFFLHGRHEFDWLLRQPVDREGDPEIVMADIYGAQQPPALEVLFSSFEQKLFNEAFNTLRLGRFDHQQSVLVPKTERNPNPLMEKAHTIALQLGFSCISQSVGIEADYDRVDAALSVGRMHPVDPFSCWIGATNEREAKRLAQVLCDNLGGYVKPVR